MSHRRVFVSYRRAADAADAADLVAELTGRLGPDHVFHDIDPASLPPGIHWPRELLESVLRAEILVPVIGPGWLEELQRRNRSDSGWISCTHSEDWVRKEIALALGVGKTVIPVLVHGAGLPRGEDLPPDLQSLTEQQLLVLPAGDPERSRELQKLYDRLQGPLPTPSLQTGWPWEHETAPIPPEEEGIYTRFGQPWTEDTEEDTPHSYDYKFSILDSETRHRLRVLLLAANQAGHLSAAFSLALLEQLGRPRKFAHSEKKEGLFLQATCLITDGLDGDPQRVLLCVRDRYQIHDLTREARRHVDGESCLFSTCLTSFRKLDPPTGHLSTAILNSLDNPNPWALFSRKLLIPDALIDCRFVGIGFNFTRPNREYVFLVWHVRTRNCPPALLVPARQELNYDLPLWQTREEVAQFDFERAAVDRLVLERVLKIPFEDGRRGADSPLVGFVPCHAFEQTYLNRGAPERWFRDTVVLDLLRFYQQQVHRNRRPVRGLTSRELLADLQVYLRETLPTLQLQLEAELLTEPRNAGEFSAVLRLNLLDEEKRVVHPFVVVAAITENEQLSSEVAERCLRQLQDGFDYLGESGSRLDPRALFVLQGVRSDQRFRVQGALTVNGGPVPIHVVKVALLPSHGEPSLKEVVHGILPTRSRSDGPIDGLLVTRSLEDELPRLPGGKIETGEKVGAALVRELREELDLPAGEIRDTVPIEKNGITVRAVSPSTGLLTPYCFYPFVVRLTEAGQARMRAVVRQPYRHCRVAPVTLETFRVTGLGFDPVYAQAILDRITPEVLASAAITLE